MSLTILAVDDERPALDELEYLLSGSPGVTAVITASDATAALRELGRHSVDAIFLDINMPGLSGLELAEVLRNYADPPPVVFVTAHDDKAVDAFAVGALDYLLKPIRDARLAEAIDRSRRSGESQERADRSGTGRTGDTTSRTGPRRGGPGGTGRVTCWCAAIRSAGSRPSATTPGCIRRRVPIWFEYRCPPGVPLVRRRFLRRIGRIWCRCRWSPDCDRAGRRRWCA